jgi:hypothetical protein
MNNEKLPKATVNNYIKARTSLMVSSEVTERIADLAKSIFNII